jgi:hypothetical protein
VIFAKKEIPGEVRESAGQRAKGKGKIAALTYPMGGGAERIGNYGD